MEVNNEDLEPDRVKMKHLKEIFADCLYRRAHIATSACQAEPAADKCLSNSVNIKAFYGSLMMGSDDDMKMNIIFDDMKCT